MKLRAEFGSSRLLQHMLPLKVVTQEPKFPANFLVCFTDPTVIEGSHVLKACLAFAMIIVKYYAEI